MALISPALTTCPPNPTCCQHYYSSRYHQNEHHQRKSWKENKNWKNWTSRGTKVVVQAYLLFITSVTLECIFCARAVFSTFTHCHSSPISLMRKLVQEELKQFTQAHMLSRATAWALSYEANYLSICTLCLLQRLLSYVLCPKYSQAG